MAETQLDAVTGAFGYTGKYITRRLLETGRQVRTLTGHPERSNPFGDKIQVARMGFSRRNDLVASLQGVDTLYNTYWVRFDYDRTTFNQAVENGRILFDAAREAGVRRVVHISITNPSHASPLPYFSGKARVEKALVDSGVSYAIVRPTVVFGIEDILINNIAWFLRTFPVFFVPGDGKYSSELKRHYR
jgi:NADH dehydrogenase